MGKVIENETGDVESSGLLNTGMVQGGIAEGLAGQNKFNAPILSRQYEPDTLLNYREIYNRVHL